MVCNALEPWLAITAWQGTNGDCGMGRGGSDRFRLPPPSLWGSVSRGSASSPTAVQERQRLRQPYPNYRVIVLDDNVNTFQHVVDCLVRHLPGMRPDQAWELAHRIDGEGAATVWRGPQEQAELYHQLLGGEGLTMAPLERD